MGCHEEQVQEEARSIWQSKNILQKGLELNL